MLPRARLDVSEAGTIVQKRVHCSTVKGLGIGSSDSILVRKDENLRHHVAAFSRDHSVITQETTGHAGCVRSCCDGIINKMSPI
jgi:hypothetical protein